MPAVLIEDWRRRARECRMSNPAGAEVYEQCADELEQLDVHTEAATDGSPLPFRRGLPMAAASYVPWLAVGAVVAGVLGGVRGSRRRASRARPMGTRYTSRDVTPPHGDKLLPYD
jgi:hypothetical protein